uniref:NADH dehydrogenase subunit 6 n=1 Tax=Corbicula fluminea TaxID=45949 RepID=A0A8E5NHB0_CORFM|nr:NADH dehydrogenase subunit 6 [Corbicula fluminea]QYH50565.1 NADH dehydrogenase subunit 6 [Corbicula sp. QL-2021]WNS59841.1 NADH dehydrogenase subunit 6 [Corbicula fluminea]
MEVFVLFFLLVVSQMFLSFSFPLALGAVILSLGVLVALLMVMIGGPLFGFSFFMVLVGGVLVVFGYTISLVPFIKVEGKGMVFNSKWFYLSLFLVSCSFWWMVSSETYKWVFLSGVEIFFFSGEWGVVIVLLSVLLLVVMITVVSVAGKQHGALIK